MPIPRKSQFIDADQPDDQAVEIEGVASHISRTLNLHPSCQLLTRQQVCTALGYVGTTIIDKLVQAGQLTPRKMADGHPKYRIVDVARLIVSQN